MSTLSSWRGRIPRLLMHPAVKPAVFVLCLLPLADLVWRAAQSQLGANPAEALIRALGLWTLKLLWCTLAITPLRQWTGWHALARWRRMLGLFTAFYATLHLLAYAIFDMGGDLPAVWDDLTQRPFIWVGMLTWVLLLPLVATSMDRAIRALGAARWKRLHRSVWVIAGLGLLHFVWMRAAKQRWDDPLFHACVLLALVGARAWQGRSRTRAAA